MKVNVLIDTNNYFYGDLDSLSDSDSKLNTEEEVKEFRRKINKRVEFLLKELPSAANVYFLVDTINTTWRKQILQEYKEKRKQGNGTNWGNFNNVVKDLTNASNNFKFVYTDGLEVDDLMLLTTNILKNDNSSLNIIVTTDTDYLQLLDKRVVMYNTYYKNRRFTFCEQYTIDDIEDERLKNYIKTNFKFETVDSNEGVVYKVLSGDSSRNIDSICEWDRLTVKNKLIRTRLTKSYVDKIKLEFENRDIEFSVKDLLKNFKVFIDVLFNITENNVSFDTVKTNLTTNIKLKFLSKQFIPKHIQQNFKI